LKIFDCHRPSDASPFFLRNPSPQAVTKRKQRMIAPDLSIIPTRPTTPSEARRLLRTEIKAAESWAYFDHSAVSPLPTSTANAIRTFATQAETNGDWEWPEWASLANRLRSNASKLLHCKSSEIALIPNTTFGINLVALGFRWNSHQGTPPNVVVLENEFSSNLLPWTGLRRLGVEVRQVSVDPDGVVDLNRIRDAIDSRTQIVSASWVGYISGYRLDLAKLCDMVHERGAKLFVDAIQGLGVFPCDLSSIPIDFLAADGHKWLLGPEGAGILFVRENNLDSVHPMMLGWGSLQSAHSFDNKVMTLKNDASVFEGGSANHAGQLGLERSMQLLLELGSHDPDSPVASAVLENADQIEEELRKIGANVYRDKELAEKRGSFLSGIVAFEMPNREPQQIRTKLIHEKVMLSVRHGRLRVATHAYNDEKDIQRLIDGIRN
jgi:cysteine desulfurase / selenocysteine lyase